METCGVREISNYHLCKMEAGQYYPIRHSDGFSNTPLKKVVGIMKRLTSQEEHEILAQYELGYASTTIGRNFGIYPSRVCRIVDKYAKNNTLLTFENLNTIKDTAFKRAGVLRRDLRVGRKKVKFGSY